MGSRDADVLLAACRLVYLRTTMPTMIADHTAVSTIQETARDELAHLIPAWESLPLDYRKKYTTDGKYGAPAFSSTEDHAV